MKIDVGMLRDLAKSQGVHPDTVLDVVTGALNDAYAAQEGATEGATVSLAEDGAIIVTAPDGTAGSVPAFGRIAAATARQAVLSWTKDLQRRRVVGAWANRENHVVDAIVLGPGRTGELRMTVDGVAAVMPAGEQTPGETLPPGAEVKALLLAANVDNRGNIRLTVSRRQPTLVSQLIADAAPYVRDGQVEVVGVAREPGVRTKVALRSHNAHVDAVEHVVGAAGHRMRQVMEALGGEKVDLVRFHDDLAAYAAAALTPVKAAGAVVLDEPRRQVQVVVPAAQLPLVNAADGLNLRLANRLTRAKIVIAPGE